MAQGFIERLFDRNNLSPKTKKWFRIFLVVFWGMSISFLLWSSVKNWNQISPYLANVSLTPMGPAVGWYLVCLGCAILLWLLIMRGFNTGLSWKKNFQIYAVTFAARRLPGTIWYIGGRLVLYQKTGVSKTIVLLASVVELLVTYLAAGLLYCLTMLRVGARLPLPITGTVVVVTIAGLLVSSPPVMALLLKRYRLNGQLWNRWGNWIGTTLVSVWLWLFGGLMVGQLVVMLKPALTVDDRLFIIAAWSLAGLAGLLTYLLPSSFGATELSLTILLAQILPLPLAGAVAVAVRVFTLAMEFLFSILFYPVLMRFPLEVAEGN